MTKKLLFLVAVSGLIFANNGCTSKKADDGEQVVENADIEKIEADGMGTPEGDSSVESALGETPTPSDSSAAAAPASACRSSYVCGAHRTRIGKTCFAIVEAQDTCTPPG